MKRVLLSALLLLALTIPGQSQYPPDSAEVTVAQWYKRYLGRTPDPYAGGWVDALRNGADPNQLLAGILGSNEYYNNAGRTPAGFVIELHMDLLGRRPTAGELRHWVNRVYRDSRTDVAYDLLTRHAQDDDPPPRVLSPRYDYRRPYKRWR